MNRRFKLVLNCHYVMCRRSSGPLRNLEISGKWVDETDTLDRGSDIEVFRENDWDFD